VPITTKDTQSRDTRKIGHKEKNEDKIKNKTQKTTQKVKKTIKMD